MYIDPIIQKLTVCTVFLLIFDLTICTCIWFYLCNLIVILNGQLIVVIRYRNYRIWGALNIVPRCAFKFKLRSNPRSFSYRIRENSSSVETFALAIKKVAWKMQGSFKGYHCWRCQVAVSFEVFQRWLSYNFISEGWSCQDIQIPRAFKRAWVAF